MYILAYDSDEGEEKTIMISCAENPEGALSDADWLADREDAIVFVYDFPTGAEVGLAYKGRLLALLL